MLQVDMTAAVRKVTGKGPMRQLRSQGQTPAVVYADGAEALPLQMETQPLYSTLLKVLRRNAIINLQLDDGTKKHVIVKDVQTDPIKDTLIHVDFQEIEVSKARVFEVPIIYTGNAKGCDLGGILNVIKDTIAIEAAPLDVPDELTMDISKLNIGDSIQVDAFDIPGNVTLIASPDEVCVSVVSTKKTTETEEEDEAAEEITAEETTEE